MNNHGEMIIPIFIPTGGSSEPEKIKCPHCKKEFVPPDRDPSIVVLLLFVICGIFIFLGFGYGGYACIKYATDVIDYLLGYFLISIDLAIIIGLAMEVWGNKK